jgi:Tn3 transposase DDE domain
LGTANLPIETMFAIRSTLALFKLQSTLCPQLLAHLAPLGWQHINLTGDYLWGTDASIGRDGFRPLRGISANLPTAKAIAA